MNGKKIFGRPHPRTHFFSKKPHTGTHAYTQAHTRTHTHTQGHTHTFFSTKNPWKRKKCLPAEKNIFHHFFIHNPDFRKKYRRKLFFVVFFVQGQIAEGGENQHCFFERKKAGIHGLFFRLT